MALLKLIGPTLILWGAFEIHLGLGLIVIGYLAIVALDFAAKRKLREEAPLERLRRAGRWPE